MSLVESTNQFTCFVSPRWISFQTTVIDPTNTTSLLASLFAALSWQESIEPSALLLHHPQGSMGESIPTLFAQAPLFSLSLLPWSTPWFSTVSTLQAPAVAISLELSTALELPPPVFSETTNKLVLQTTPHHYVGMESYTGYTPKKLRFPSLRKTRAKQEAPPVLTICATMLHAQAFGENSLPLQVKTLSLRLQGDSPYCVLHALESNLNSSILYVHGASSAVITALQRKYETVQVVHASQAAATLLRLISLATPAVFLDFSVESILSIHLIS